MAIIKSLQSSYGIAADYHKIVSIAINYQKKKVVICVASFVSKKLRAENYDPIDTIDVEVPLEDYPLFISSNVIETAYNWLKENVVGFEEAIDDYDSFVEVTEENDKEEINDEGSSV